MDQQSDQKSTQGKIQQMTYVKIGSVVELVYYREIVPER